MCALFSFGNSGTCYKVDETEDKLSAVSQSVKGQCDVSCLDSQAHRAGRTVAAGLGSGQQERSAECGQGFSLRTHVCGWMAVTAADQ